MTAAKFEYEIYRLADVFYDVYNSEKYPEILNKEGVIKFFDGLPKTMRGKFEGLVPKTSNSLMVESDGLI